MSTSPDKQVKKLTLVSIRRGAGPYQSVFVHAAVDAKGGAVISHEAFGRIIAHFGHTGKCTFLG